MFSRTDILIHYIIYSLSMCGFSPLILFICHVWQCEDRTNLAPLKSALVDALYQTSTFAPTSSSPGRLNWPAFYSPHEYLQSVQIAASNYLQSNPYISFRHRNNVKKSESAVVADDDSPDCKGIGTVLNLWRNKRDGCAVHVVLQAGWVSMGSAYFKFNNTIYLQWNWISDCYSTNF